jgi:membrane dipeptidase
MNDLHREALVADAHNEAAHRIADANSDEVALCTAPGDLAAATAAGKIALILALEGCPQIDNDLELLQTMQRLGVRMASFTHFGRSALGDGSGEDAAGSRLTQAGVEAVGLLEELGVLIDVSHVGRGGVEHILELATKPVVASHSSAFGLREHPGLRPSCRHPGPGRRGVRAGPGRTGRNAAGHRRSAA